MSIISRIEFDKLYENLLADNSAGKITPENLRAVFDNLSDSTIWHDEGVTGPAGTDGASAYEIAVENGFPGTAAAWLDSLIGPKGPEGAVGPAGSEGAIGPAGRDGAPGADGRTVRDVRVASATALTVTEADDGVVIIIPTGGATVTLPSDAAVPLRFGTIVYLIQNCDEVVCFEPSAGVALDIYPNYLAQAAKRGCAIAALKVGANHWRVHGDLAPQPDVIPFASGGAVCGVRVATLSTSVGVEDEGGLLEMSATTDVSVTLPSDAGASIPCGSVVHVAQANSGGVSFTADSGTTLLFCASKDNRISGQHGVVRAIKSAPNTWRLTGDLAELRAFA